MFKQKTVAQYPPHHGDRQGNGRGFLVSMIAFTAVIITSMPQLMTPDTKQHHNSSVNSTIRGAIDITNAESTNTDKATPDTTIKNYVGDGQKMKYDDYIAIIDCIMYNGEPIVPVRLKLLNATVN